MSAIQELSALRRLDTPDRIDAMGRVMAAAFGRPRSHKSVGQQLGISKERVRQLERRALRHLGDGLLRQLSTHA
jgi:DNA-directed RNA polymerase sigma subunit (sigma70/sigma32)